MNKILKIANEVDIIGMGESTHGQDKIDMYRAKVFKNLVTKCGYTVFILEDQYSSCSEINDYIKGSKNKLKNVMESLMLPWKSIHMYKLIKWMREYNKKHNNKLEFVGIDIQFDTGFDTRDNVILFVNKLIKKYQDLVNNKKFNYLEIYNFRDKYMFEVFMKLYDPLKKYFIWAHNGHLEKHSYPIGKNNIVSLGVRLHKKFKSKYYVIGNTFYNGSYIGLNPITKKMEIAKIPKIKYVTKLKSGLYFSNKLKIEKIPEGGSAASKKDPLKYIFLLKYKNRFDALLVINNEKPRKIIGLYNVN